MSQIILEGRLDGSQRMRLGKLLNMFYTPSELASEIGCTTRQIYRVYVPLGCPHIQDEKKHHTINGKAFAEWYEATYPKKTLLEDEAFCLTCKKPVKMHNPTQQKKGLLIYWISICPVCGRKLPRIISKEKNYGQP